MQSEQNEDVFEFLGGTFHQDIESPEHAFEEFLRETSRVYLKDAVLFLKEFINSALTKEEKNSFIEESADGIYFPALEEPIDWLQKITLQIETELNK
jgi:hypothetical protein